MNALAHLGEVSREYQRVADEYRDVVNAAAKAEAEHKVARAKAVLRHKATTTERMSHAEAETRAEADDEIADLYQRRLIAAADAEALKQKLIQLREQNANGRVAAASEREVDRIHAGGWSGAA